MPDDRTAVDALMHSLAADLICGALGEKYQPAGPILLRMIGGEPYGRAAGLDDAAVGGRTWEKRRALIARDAAVIEAARLLADDLGRPIRTSTLARALHRQLVRYAAATWRSERGAREMPAGPFHLKSFLWLALTAIEAVPSHRTIRAILAADRRWQEAPSTDCQTD